MKRGRWIGKPAEYKSKVVSRYAYTCKEFDILDALSLKSLVVNGVFCIKDDKGKGRSINACEGSGNVDRCNP